MVNKDLITYNLFVFGNGFDLTHGLPTKYADYLGFLQVLSSYASRAANDKAGWLNNAIANIEGSYRLEITDAMCKYFEDIFSHPPLPAYLDTIIDTLSLRNPERLNHWHSYFVKQLSRDEISQYTWIDFESEIQKLITDINSIPLVHSDLLDQICKITGSDKPSFSPEICCLDTELKSSSGSNMKSQTSQRLRNELGVFLYHQLLRYAFCFELYLRFYVVEYCIGSPPKEADFFIDRLFTEYLPDSAEQANQFVLSFNYTDTVEQIYQSHDYYGRLENIHHLHGMIRSAKDLEAHMNNDEYKLATPLVLGFHNANEKLNQTPSPFIWFEKFYQRMLHHTGTDIYKWLNRVNLCRHSVSGQYTRIRAVFYGHSFDVTDADLIKKIFSVADFIEIYYHDESALPSILTNLVRIFGKEKLEEDYTGCKLSFILAKLD